VIWTSERENSPFPHSWNGSAPANGMLAEGILDDQGVQMDLDVLDCCLWPTGFGLRNRRRNTLCGLPLGNERSCLML